MMESTAETGRAMDEEAMRPEHDLVRQWNDRIDQGKKDNEKLNRQIEEHRRYVRGVRSEDDATEEQVRTNLIYATLASMLPHVYAKNPEIAVTPSEAVDPSQYPAVKGFAKSLEIAVNRQLEDANLKKRAKAAVRAAMTARIGWVKVLYQRDMKTDPIIQNRINDVQENIRRIQYLIEECDDAAEREHNEAKKAELEHQVKALEAQVEVSVAEGIVIDRLLTEDVIIDSAVKDFDSYVDAEWIAHRIWYRPERYEEVFGKEVDSKAKMYTAAGRESSSAKRSDTDAYLAVWEIWHKGSNTVYTLCEGEMEWARDPYQPQRLGEQWYPFFPLGLHPVDGQFQPMSTVELLKGLQDEYEQIRSDYAELRRKNKPHYVTSSETPERDIQRKVVAGIGEVVIVDANGRPLREVFDVAQQLPIDPAQYDTSQIRADMEWMSGLGDAARGSIMRAKTATEAQIMQAGLASRTTEMQDAIEDWIRDMAQYVAEILLQELTPAQVRRLAGDTAVWPQLRKEDVFDLVKIEIRAGTTGKPDKQREQESWVKFMPQLRDLIAQVSELRRNGDTETADALVRVARETIRRFDERFDVEEFLPQNAGKDQPNGQLMQIQQQMAEMQKQMALLDAQIRKTNAEAAKTEVDAAVTAQGLGGVMPPIDGMLQ